MHTKALIAGAALISSAVAAPAPAGASSSWTGWQPPSTAAATSPAGSPAPLQSGNPFSFPLSNGFPNLSPQALKDTEVQAHGTPPNGPLPILAPDDLTSIRLIAFNEIFEVAFFTDLLYNVTNNVPGFAIEEPFAKQIVVNALTGIQAQEELHAAAANLILGNNNQAAIQPCKYKFPTTNLADAIALAKTFTDVVMGTLQDVQLHLAQNSDAGFVPVIGSVIGQEGEQTGFFRLFGGLIPSELPFLTRAAREFAFSVLNQGFVVPGSCPNANLISLPIFEALTVTTSPIAAQDQTLSFSVSVTNQAPTAAMSLVYLNGQNTPVVQKISNAVANAGTVTFDAYFPYTENVMNGLTIAALVNGTGPFASAGDVAKATIAGPGLIEIN